MLKSVFVTNHHGERYELPLDNPEASGFLIKNISGMGPIKTSINTSSGALSPGEFFNSSKIEKRNIVIDLIYYPDSGMIEDQRLLAYRIFEVNTPIDIEFRTDRSKVIAHGYVESHEPVIFSQQCETSISIICPDPFLYTTKEKIFNMSDIVRAFQFPFFNPDPYDPPYDLDPETGDPRFEPTILMGYFDTNSIKTLHNEGNASGIGIEIIIEPTIDALSGFVFGNNTNDEHFMLDDSALNASVPNGILRGDKIIISTLRGNKFITLYRKSGDDYIMYNILPAKVYNSDWVTLDSGDNNIYYYCNGGNNSSANVYVKYTPAYIGI